MKLKTTFVSLLIALLASTQVAFALATTSNGSPLTPPITTPIPDKFTNLSAQMPYPGSATFNFNYTGSAGYFYVNASTLQDMSWDVYGRFAEGAQNPIVLSNPTKWDKYSCNRTLYWRVESILGEKSQIQSTTINCSSSIPVGTFTNLSANLASNSAYFNFTYSGPSTPSYAIDMSTYSDMSWDVYMGFASSNSAPITLSNPQAKWDKYSCGKTLYWRAYDATRRSISSIQTATINCATPTPTPTPTPIPSNITSNLTTTSTLWPTDINYRSGNVRVEYRSSDYFNMYYWLEFNPECPVSGIRPGVYTYTGVTKNFIKDHTIDLLNSSTYKQCKITLKGRNIYGNGVISEPYIIVTVQPSSTPTPSAAPIATPVAAVPVPTKVINGNINYRITKTVKAGKYTRNVNAAVPASGVTVEATNLSTGEKFTAKTNLLGKYNLKVKLGQYKLRAYDTKQTVFSQVGNFTFTGILNTIRFW